MMPPLDAVLRRLIASWSARNWPTAALCFAAYYGALRLLHKRLAVYLNALARRTTLDLDDMVVAAISRISRGEIAVLALYLATRPLTLPSAADRALRALLVATLAFRAAAMIQEALVYFLGKTAAFAEHEPNSSSVHQNLRLVIKAVVWVGALMFVLDNVGVNITTAVAGLGIGGVAAAMAGQQILGDLFSSFVIFMDKPFQVGDFIVLGDMMGTVERIGIKTSRVRSLGGELLIFSNSDLTNSRIRNYQQMQKRRVVFSFGVVYQTPPEKLEAIPAMVREVVAAIPQASIDRAHFKSFGASSLDYEVVYYVLSGDYNLYMDVQHRINIELAKRFAGAAIDFAYPTRTVILSR